MLRDDAIMPYRGHVNDAGLDCPVPDDGILRPGPNKIPLGWAIEIPVGYCAYMLSRSGMASGEKTLDMPVWYPESHETALYKCKDNPLVIGDLYVNGVAITAENPPIDPGYTGQVHAIITNHGSANIAYKRGTRFSQLVVFPMVYAIPTIPKVGEKQRKNDAFGSTGL